MLTAGGKNPYIVGTVKYWLSGEDAPINNAWVDRVSGLSWSTIRGSSSISQLYIPAEKCYFFDKGQDGLRLADMNSANINLGHHWRIVFDVDYISPAGLVLRSALWDFGSITVANHAFGLFLCNSEIGINWKMQGNDRNPGLSITDTEILPKGNDWQRLKGYYEITDGKDGYDRFSACVNNTKIVCPVKVPKVEYAPTWDVAENYIANGIALTAMYHAYVKIHDLIVCVID